MKKVLIGLCYLMVSFGVIYDYSYAATASFVTKDARMFCETDTFDGSYRLCSARQKSGTGLVKAEHYGPRLVETPTEKICVEDGKEVGMALCQNVTKSVIIPPVTMSGRIETTSNHTATSAINQQAILTDPIPSVNTGRTTASVEVSLGPVMPSNPIVEAVITDYGLISSLQMMYVSCIQDDSGINCGTALGNIATSIVEMGTFFILALSVIFVFFFVFWSRMLIYAIKHAIPAKIIWIIVILIFSLPGAIIYYFFGKRPYVAKIVASLPARPPSFFN